MHRQLSATCLSHAGEHNWFEQLSSQYGIARRSDKVVSSNDVYQLCPLLKSNARHQAFAGLIAMHRGQQASQTGNTRVCATTREAWSGQGFEMLLVSPPVLKRCAKKEGSTPACTPVKVEVSTALYKGGLHQDHARVLIHCRRDKIASLSRSVATRRCHV